MKRVVITGATGFVGANLARRALCDGHQVHLLVRPEHPAWRIAGIRDEVTVHAVALEDREAVAKAIRAIRPEWAFHLAAHGAYSWQSDVPRIVQTNVMGTINLVDACVEAGVETVVNTGSSSEYGYKDHAPAETEALEPNSAYAVTKAAATMFCRFTAGSRGVRIPTLRLYSVFGPYEEPNRLVPALIVRGLEGRLPRLANPDIARDYVYVDDVTDAYMLVAGAPLLEPGAVYNVGTGVQTTLRDIVDASRRLLGVSTEPSWGSFPDRKWDTTIWRADVTRIGKELGWTPRHDMEGGLRETIAWFRAEGGLRASYREQLRS
jgi:UDP-glucose 4-epimerase